MATNVISRTVFKKSTWKDAGAGAVAGGIEAVSTLFLGSGILGSIVTAVTVGAMPSKKGGIFDETSKTAIVTNTVRNATLGLLIG